MMDYIKQYSLNKEEKHKILTSILSELTLYHYQNCKAYHDILNTFSFDVNNIKSYYYIPFLPVRLFKKYDLLSIDKKDIFKTMMSSGTTGQEVSKIYLNKETAISQQKALVKIVSSYIEQKRLPMLIIDSPAVIKNRNLFSARGAGITGFSIFGNDITYALDENMDINIDRILLFLEKHKNEKILIFGFTYIIWKHFYKEIINNLDLSNGILFHGGGWKKLSNEAVSPEEFKLRLYDSCKLTEIHDYYGMVEQTGSIYMECEAEHLHAPIYSDIIIRRYQDFSVADIGEKGIIEVVSILPESYPGHALLTEDEGILLGEDNFSKCA